jgi:O-glycosyl hydrolase
MKISRRTFIKVSGAAAVGMAVGMPRSGLSSSPKEATVMLRLQVDFSRKIRDWDGFGVNYVEASQTRDYAADPQEYGGFSVLSEEDRQQILDMIFSSEGLKPGIAKMFLDPFHQAPPGPDCNQAPNVIDLDAYDHATTTEWMRYFVKQGLARTRADGRDLQIIVTLYGPPAWMTKQKFVRGRDLDPEYKFECAKYMISWAKYLREVEGFPVKYISLHNEGEDWKRWPLDGSTADSPRHDYNMYWPPEQVVDFIKFMPDMLEKQGMQDVGVTPGETSNWYRFSEWGYADAIADDPEAVKKLGLITSHGFYGPRMGRWYGDWRSLGTDAIRAKRPDIHCWVTSTSWSKMDAFFVNEIRNNIYSAKLNGLIPWAVVQWQGKWVGGDPNPGTAFRVYDDGRFTVEAGYYFYKQVCRAGQPGMSVCRVLSNDSDIGLIGFGSNGTGNPDAFVVLNLSDDDRDLDIGVLGSNSRSFSAYRTSSDEQYVSLGYFAVSKGMITYTAPAESVTTFYGNS